MQQISMPEYHDKAVIMRTMDHGKETQDDEARLPPRAVNPFLLPYRLPTYYCYV